MNLNNDYIKNFYNDLSDDNNVKCSIIPVSTKKILNNGFSYVNNTIHNYYNNNNISYDVEENEHLVYSILKTSLLAAFVATTVCGIGNNSILSGINLFRGISNQMEHVGQVNNIKFINNLEANNDVLWNSLSEIYNDNIYVILVVDSEYVGSLVEGKYNGKNVKKIFIIDIHGLVRFNTDGKNSFKFNNFDDAINKAIGEAELEEKENNIVVLLSSVIGDVANDTLYDVYGTKFRETVALLEKKYSQCHG
jgi:UDP-N-acetylmuramoylalanine-D-glutamate ligase